ncbi:MAG TPA: TIGR01777 family oxidoreductase [Planctomycetota bacterium]|nr:TIGR01777 family oxidoreductase [Planctomycetota bacterium]
MNILISGSTGLVGSALCSALAADGHSLTTLTRPNSKSAAKSIEWNPLSGKLDPAALTGIDAVVHLAGENIAGRWTAAKKKAIRESRVLGTKTLANALAAMTVKPKVLICASAIGYYGNRGDELLTESSSPGKGFLPEVCQAWESAADPARAAGIRTVALRFGVILSENGGALAKMLTPFKLCLGGIIGSGKQYMSWIALDDVVGAILFALKTESLSGPANTVAPNPVTNREFTKTLGKVIKRPTIFPMPAFAARLAFGEMANDLLLGSTRVTPSRLTDAGFVFKWPRLEDALRHLLQ